MEFNTPPIIGSVIASPRYVTPGESIKITAYIFDAEHDIDSVSVEIESPDENVLTILTLYDDGIHGDGSSDDNIYCNTWVTTLEERNYFVDIFATDKKSNSSISINVAYFTVTSTKPTYNIYFGNLHSHTSYSDGVETPAVAFQHARDLAKIDFLAVTDHIYSLDTQAYKDILDQADIYTEDDVFVAIAGQEWTGPIGHINVFDSD